MLRTALNIKQLWKTSDCIKWFIEYDKNNKCYFVIYDIRKFFSSITEKSVNEALKLAKGYTVISEDEIIIINYCHKSILYHNEILWIKKGVSGNIDYPMGSLDGALLNEFIAYWYTN